MRVLSAGGTRSAPIIVKHGFGSAKREKIRISRINRAKGLKTKKRYTNGAVLAAPFFYATIPESGY